LAKYGGEVQIRRPGHPLFGRTATVSRVHLVYDAEGLTPSIKETLETASRRFKIELHFHAR
jgi:hypothetical protein